MPTLHAGRWNKVWLSKPWEVRPVPGSAQVELHGVRGYLTRGDIAYLFNLGVSLPDGGNYLEVGSWLGLSAILVANGLLANLNFEGRVYCVDTWRGSPEHQGLPEVVQDALYPQFLANVRAAQMDWFIRPMRGDSAEAAGRWPGPALDVIFIDGDHSRAGCRRDIAAWHPRLKAGGRLLGHDAVPGGEVEAAVRAYALERGYEASVCPMPASHYVWELRPRGSPLSAGHVPLA